MRDVRGRLHRQSCVPGGWETGRREIQPEIPGSAHSSGETTSHLTTDVPRVRKEFPVTLLVRMLVKGSRKPFFL